MNGREKRGFSTDYNDFRQDQSGVLEVVENRNNMVRDNH